MKNWKTSLVGLALVVGSIYTGVAGLASWTEVLLAVTAGIGFLYSKDYDKTGVSSKKLIGGRPRGRQ